MANYSLDQLRADIETKYGALVIDLGDGNTATLRPVLRMPKADRAAFMHLQGQLNSTEPDQADDSGDGGGPVEKQVEVMRAALNVVAEPDGSYQRLMDALTGGGYGNGHGDVDPATLITLFEQYIEVSMPGEASPSGT